MKEEERDEYVRYRLEKAYETYEVAQLLAENEKWNSVINRLYYAAYYAVSSLLMKAEIETKTHTGVKTNFFLYFIKSGRLDAVYGKLYADLFDWRQKGDYGDFFDFGREDVELVLAPTKVLMEEVKKLIETPE